MRHNIIYDRTRATPVQMFAQNHGTPKSDLKESADDLPEILIITSYPPRECGIATYTQDLKRALQVQFSNSFSVSICALEPGNCDYNYPEEVRYKLNAEEIADYHRMADSINADHKISSIILQHEFGLVREDGLVQFLSRISKPVITVFHTVLPHPDDLVKSNVARIVSLSSAVVVMTQKSRTIMLEDYAINPDAISVIPHGTHQAPQQDKNLLKVKYELEGRQILSTFGLLGSGKSIETTLEALPEIIKVNPDVMFLILGKTHPEVVKSEGESYREMLQNMVVELNIQNHVRFVNHYLELNDLLEYLQLTDIYLFTSRDPNQAVSGTFAYAMSCGCPIISTPIPHAVEVLNDSTGMLFDFRNSGQLAEKVNLMLNDSDLLEQMSHNALQQMAYTTWDNSAVAHANLIANNSTKEFKLKYNFPSINLKHLQNMTTASGMIQFSKINIPDLTSGYTLDDNARAMIAMCMHLEGTRNTEDIDVIGLYLSFIEKCLQPAGYFLNYVDENGDFTKQNYSTNLADASGRAIWALGFLIQSGDLIPQEMRSRAQAIFHRAVARLHLVHSTRAMAFAIKGLYYCNQYSARKDYSSMIKMLAGRMADMFRHEAEDEWQWFESYLTYANAVLPEAMLLAYLDSKEESYKQIAMRSFDFFLSNIYNEDGIKVISNRSWLHKNRQAELYGEQPIDVAYTILALGHFYDVYQHSDLLDKMKIAFNWFLGQNHLKQVMYNSSTGGCYDGLEETQVNMNQGAESTLSYLIARLTTEKYILKTGKSRKNRELESQRRLYVH